ncbi:MAG: lysine--tRNA ligase [Clostridia bacterium]|nr:lysine--tRNA ligase [Clostridia bacterium]
MEEIKREEMTNEELGEVLRVRREKLASLVEAGQDPFRETTFDRTNQSVDILNDYEGYEGKTVRLAGRLISKRIMGKASFSDVQDRYGSIQIYVKKDEVGEEAFAAYKKLDIGDIIGFEGYAFKTKTGQISIHVTSYKLLSKSLQPLPEKYHGLRDTDLRYRRRYVDLIVNPEVRRVFETRSKIINEIRSYLNEKDFIEVETPVLSTVYGGAAARPFVTKHNTLDIEMFLRISLELNLKRLIVGGMEKVYEIGRVFRNEGMDARHNPEFTLMELYEAYTDYHGMMRLTEDIYHRVANLLGLEGDLDFRGRKIDILSPFRKVTMADAVKEVTGVDMYAFDDSASAIAAANSVGVYPKKEATWGEVLFQIFDEKVESTLIQPTFIIDHPIEVSPLAKKSPRDPRLTERFELFINGWEMANAFTELNDPIDQKERFMRQVELRAAGDEEANMMDEDFVFALENGMPPTGGVGIGIDRMVMLFTGADTIRDVLLFPTMKPLDMPKKEEAKEEAPVAEEAKPEVIDFSKVEIEPLFQEFVDFETFSKSDFRAVKVLKCEAVKKSKKLLQFTLNDGTETERTILSGIHAYYEPEELVGKTLIAITNLPPRPMMGVESNGMLLSAIHTEEGEEKLHLLMVDDHIPAGAKLY